jgi:hypothetical protein
VLDAWFGSGLGSVGCGKWPGLWLKSSCDLYFGTVPVSCGKVDVTCFMVLTVLFSFIYKDLVTEIQKNMFRSSGWKSIPQGLKPQPSCWTYCRG